MKNSKLLELLISIPQKEVGHLLEYAKLSANELSVQDLSIFKLLLARISNSQEVDEEAIVQEILTNYFHGQLPKTAKKNWNYLKGKFTSAVNGFIIFQHINKSPQEGNLFLLEYYKRRKLDKNWKGLVKKTEADYKKREKDSDSEYRNYKFNEIVLSSAQGQRIHLEALENMNLALDNFYFENKLRILVEKYNRKRIMNTAEPVGHFVNYINKGQIELNTIGGQLFLALYHMMIDPEDMQQYFVVKDLFEKNKASFSLEYRRSICENLMNQCIYYCHKGEWDFAKEYIDFIKYLISEKLFYSVTGISITKYANTVYMALVSKDLYWAEQFVKKYTHLLQHEERDSIKNLNMANILFHKGGNNGKALRLLSNFDFSETYFRIAYYKLQIKLFFEEGMVPTLKDKLKAFQKYIERNKKLSPLRKTKNINFIKVVRKLLRNEFVDRDLERNDYLMLDYMWISTTKKGSS